MKRQTDRPFDAYIQKYGCFFMCIVYWFTLQIKKIDLGYNPINTIWLRAEKERDENGGVIISGDVNGDGDKDDYDECLIHNKTALCKIAELPLEYIGSFAPDKVIKAKGQYYIGEYYREWTEKGKKKSFTHFAAIDESFNCIYDPILNSNTVRLGKLKTVRVFKRTDIRRQS